VTLLDPLLAASRSRSRSRMRSRSVETALMRRDMSSFCSKGTKASSTVVAQPIDTSMVTRNCGSPSLARIWSIMGGEP